MEIDIRSYGQLMDKNVESASPLYVKVMGKMHLRDHCTDEGDSILLCMLMGDGLLRYAKSLKAWS